MVYSASTEGDQVISGLSQGIYLVTLQSHQGTETVKVQVH
ncbi:MAG TPA: T9SS type A sorting domain-containing protein [Candidatus Parabacteroides intestinavium]|nr:T9SS type A sorting domain-containing protein [Candidatus Parabacteroides intestinavium]